MPGKHEIPAPTRCFDSKNGFPVAAGFPAELTLVEPENPETQSNLLAARAFGDIMRKNQDTAIPPVYEASPSHVGIVVSWHRWERLKKTAGKIPELGVRINQNNINVLIMEDEKTTHATVEYRLTGRNNLGIMLLTGNPEELRTVLGTLVRVVKEAGQIKSGNF